MAYWPEQKSPFYSLYKSCRKDISENEHEGIDKVEPNVDDFWDSENSSRGQCSYFED